MNAVFVDETGTEWYTLDGEDSKAAEGHVDMVQGSQSQGKCQKCGSRKHKSWECTTDVSKLKCFRCQGVGHVSMNCPQRNKEKGKGKDFGKGKSSVVKGDWLKGKGKEKGKGKDKGKSKGKNYGKKGKLNEVNESYDDDWWWYAASSDWDDSNWNEGYASQMSWAEHDWYGSGWETWEAAGNESQEQGQDATPVVSGKGNGNEVQSLVLSPFFAENCEMFDTGLELIDSCEDGSNCDLLHVCPQPFEHQQQTFSGIFSGFCDSFAGFQQDVSKGSEISQVCEVCFDVSGTCVCRKCQESFGKPVQRRTCVELLVEKSGPERLVNRGCPVFCICDRCQHESFQFSRQVAESVNCRKHENLNMRHGRAVMSTNVFGLRSGNRFTGDVDSEHAHETVCCDDLLSTVCSRVTLFRTRVSTFLGDTSDTVSQMHQFRRYWSQVFPLLSEISATNDDGQWWLLDSGASSTVMSSKFVGIYGGKLQQQRDGNRFRAANGSAVNMLGETEVVALVSMVSEENGRREERRACVKTGLCQDSSW